MLWTVIFFNIFIMIILLYNLSLLSIDPSGQIMQLCDQISRQSHTDQPAPVGNLPGPTSSGFVTNVQPHNFNPTFQQTPTVQQPQFTGNHSNKKHHIVLKSWTFLSAVPQMIYRQSPVCFMPQQQQMAIGQSLFMQPQQFVAPVAPIATNANRE